MSAEVFSPKDEKEMLALGAELVSRFRAGDVVLLSGELGAGKTTLVRGMLAALHFEGAVRSPTFSLVQLYQTDPAVAHVDLYRVKSHTGLGLEDLLETHLLLIEWPDRATGLVPSNAAWRVDIVFADSGRVVTVNRPD